MRRSSYFLLIFVSLLFAFFRSPIRGESIFSRKPGDVIVGALLSIRQKDEYGSCSKTRQESMLWIDALNFALDEINSNERPYNISFGLEVRDTCADGEEALEQALGLIRDRKQDGVMPRTPNQAKVGRMHPSRPVIGVIWDSANEDIATLFGLFKVPHVSFTRRAGSLSQYSFNSISVEYYQALALADLVRYFAWSSISLVYSTRNYRVFSTFQQVSGVDGICVASTIEVNEKELGNFSVAIQRLLSELQTRVVILFTTLDHTAGLLKGKT